MSTTANAAPTDGLDLSRAEQWVLHHVMIEHVDRAYDDEESPPWWAVSVAGKLESDGAAGPTPGTGVTLEDRLTTFEAWRIRHALATYTERSDVPEADAELASGILASLDAEFEPAPVTIR